MALINFQLTKMIVIIIIIAVIIVQAVIWHFAINPNLVRQEATRMFAGLDNYIAFDKSSYEPNTAAKITVIDPNANTNSATREKITVQVYSDSDSVGIPVQLEEYRVDSAKFVTHPYLVKLTNQSSNPSINALKIKSGDRIYAKYVDHTATASITSSPSVFNAPDENTVKSVKSGGFNATGSTNPSVLTNRFDPWGSLSQTGVSISATPIPVLGCFDDVDNNGQGDGICDEWEDTTSTGIMGLAIPNGMATYILNCDPNLTDPATNVNDDCPGSDMQDIYVQASYMQRPNAISQAPSSTAIDDVKRVFYQHGIRLHFLQDSQSIGYYNDLTDIPGNPTDPPGTNSFFGIKNAYFGSPEERNCQAPNEPPTSTSCAAYLPDLLTAKSQVFHYALFIHAQQAHPGSSGLAETYGNDMIISMGAFTGGVGSDDQIAGTFMHELGHNLDLGHGGDPFDQQNCKPNYVSVMNYIKQFPYFVPNWYLDYSTTRVDLDEGHLDENSGIGVEPPGVTAYSYKNTTGYWKIGTGPGSSGTSIDWSGDKIIQAWTTPLEIQNFGIPTCSETNSDPLNGFEDWPWAKAHLAFQTSDGFANGATFDPNLEREMTRGDVDTLFMKEYGINSTGKNLDVLYKDIQPNIKSKISNKGQN